MAPLTKLTAPSVDDIRAAAERIASHAVRTPLLESPHLNEMIGGRLLVKAEPLQRTGSFKFRGAFNTLAQLGPEARTGGVLTFSSGNHAQGVAAAAQLLQIPAVILMPEEAPAVKIENTRAYGAEVILYDRLNDDREAMGSALARERGATLVKPYDDPHIISGQGTVGLEIIEQVAALDTAPDAVLVCCGGGGLASGSAIALKDAFPDVRVYAVEPAGFDDTVRSLEAGVRQTNDPAQRTFCDALLTPTPGELTFEINSQLLAGGFAVTDDQVAEAMRLAFSRLKLVVEPGGAVALAAVLSGVYQAAGESVVVVCTGGNVDEEMFARVLSGAAA